MRKFGVLILLIILLYFGMSWFGASKIVEPTAKHIDIGAVFINPNYRDITFKTSDDLTLHGWHFNSESKKIIIFVPGILDNRTNDGYYGAVLAQEFIKNGYSVLMYDPRSRGDSEGSVRIRDDHLDVIAAINYSNTLGYKPENIGIVTYSAGATSTLLALNKATVRAVVLDSTPVHFSEVIDFILTRELGVPGFLIPGIHIALNYFFQFNLDDYNSLNNVPKSTDISYLIIHSKNDASVPLKNSEELKDKLGGKAGLAVFPQGSHIESFKYNPEAYRKTVFDFFAKTLK